MLFEGKIVGLDELADAAKKTGKFDYDAKIAGLEMPDRYTLRIRLKQADYNLRTSSRTSRPRASRAKSSRRTATSPAA